MKPIMVAENRLATGRPLRVKAGFDPTARDLSAEVRKAKSTNADMVWVISRLNDAILLCQEMVKQRWEPMGILSSGPGWYEVQFMKALGKYGDDVVSTVPWHDPRKPLAKALDALRGMLPAATVSNTGIYASGQAFEMALLRELGYAVILDRDAERDEPVAREQTYVYVVELGPVSAAAAPGNGVKLSGQTLIDMQSGTFTSAATQQQSKTLMRALINHYLGDQVLHTRQLLRDLQEL